MRLTDLFEATIIRGLDIEATSRASLAQAFDAAGPRAGLVHDELCLSK